MMNLIDFLKKPRNWFITKAISLVLLWEIVYDTLISKHTNIDFWLTNKVGESTGQLFNWLGKSSHFDGRYLYVDNIKSVVVADACNGLGLFALFLGFIIITPGKILHKFLYSIAGLTVLFFINMTRVYLLSVNYLKNPSTFEFNHKYTYLWLIYLAVFFLWILWLEVINKKHFARSAS
jgi:exosortase/archaeosortase family protein